MAEIAIDENGYPILLAISTATKSGNPNHDPGSGRFGSGSGSSKPVVVAKVVAVPADENARRFDAVRDAAREMDDMAQADALEFLRGRVADITKVDINAFLQDVRAQRVSDLVDSLDSSLRRGVDGMLRGRRVVRVVTPRGWQRRVLTGLSDIEATQVFDRLRARGWSDTQLVHQLLPRFKEDRRAVISSAAGLKP